MVVITSLILALGVLAVMFGLPALELAVVLVLLTPVLGALLGSLVGVGWYTYLITLLLLSFVVISLQRWQGNTRCSIREVMHRRRSELLPVLVWVGGVVVAYTLCHLWPDFVSIGERLRDYALLSSVVQHPLEAREPWMSGAVLNYYLYWYRFGAMVSHLAGLEVWQTYHLLQSVTMGLYVAVFFRFLTRHLNFSVAAALGCAVLIAFGSNVAGVVSYATQNSNWWGPSRVIPGTINEFPAWSFLLGDLHPHFLNLPLLPALVLLGTQLLPFLNRQSVWVRLGLWGSFVALVAAWTFAANAWELPFTLMTLAVVLVGVELQRHLLKHTNPVGAPAAVAALVGCFVGLWVVTALFWAQSRNITPPGDPLRFVTLPFGSQTISEVVIWIAGIFHLRIEPPVEAAIGSPARLFLMHWGLPLGLISISLVILSRDWVERVGKVLALVFGYLSGAALLLAGFIGILQGWRIVEQLRRRDNDDRVGAVFFIELLGLAATLGIIFPEILFVDDPYGGPDERMNTVFKFYSAAWGFLHLAAFALVAEAMKRLPQVLRSATLLRYAGVVAVAAFLGFFLSSMKYRVGTEFTIKPYAQGLSSIEKQFPGAGAVIQQLEKMPRGIVLEAQGGAYNFSSIVGTLSGNESFLGWANHVNLLTRKYDEVTRREQVTREFYAQSNCQERKAIMEREQIAYAVLGRSERQGYGYLDEEGFRCLDRVLQRGEYSIFALPSSAAAQ